MKMSRGCIVVLLQSGSIYISKGADTDLITNLANVLYTRSFHGLMSGTKVLMMISIILSVNHFTFVFQWRMERCLTSEA